MAKYKKKEYTIDAEQFDISKPSQWPDGCQANVISVTGYSYGTLVESDGGKNRDGFEILNNDYIITDSVGHVYRMSGTEFVSIFDAV